MQRERTARSTAEKRLACFEKVLERFDPALAEEIKKAAWKLASGIPFYSVDLEFAEMKKRYVQRECAATLNRLAEELKVQ